MTQPQGKEIELHDDAMERFKRAVDVVSKSPPQHRPPKKKARKLAKKSKKGDGRHS
ncbi:hypothetical protein [Bradyrhizobium erythrophlei]|uniref:hypothetical protein n=1 Tax=Bradyrhizobium erythrophlei TaxID=1437360 RepID=UPI0015C5731B|nr:hypothetical protein [Bradyrhizobium erythrophlei]